MQTFYKVSELIEYLESLGRDRLLLHDMDGSTFNVTSDDIKLWNENDPESPVALITA